MYNSKTFTGKKSIIFNKTIESTRWYNSYCTLIQQAIESDVQKPTSYYVKKKYHPWVFKR